MRFGGSQNAPPRRLALLSRAKATFGRSRPAAASLLALSFVLLAVAPALPASAAPSASVATGLTASGNAGSLAAGTGAVLSSGAITDDVDDAPARIVEGGAAYDQFGTRLSALGDLNNDGAADLAVVSRSPSAVTIVAGARGQMGAGTLVVLRASGAGALTGLALAGGGDLNGDGFDDFAVTSARPNGTGALVQEVQVYYGESGITQAMAHQTLQAPSLEGSFGTGLEILRDVDGDGYGDLIVSAPPSGSPPSPGAVFLYRGAASGLSATPSWSYAAENTDNVFGAAAFESGDINNDGLSDFVVTTGGEPGVDGYARIYHFLGDLSGSPVGPSEVQGSQRNDAFGASVAAGDFNGDGFSDLLLGSPQYDSSPEALEAGLLAEYDGSSVGLLTPVTRAGPAGAHYANTVANVGDLNGDGIDDAAVGAPLASADGPLNNGQVFVYFGGSTGLAVRYDMTEAGEAGYDLYGATIASRGDLDGDGRNDLALCAPARDATGAVDAGACYLYSGLRIRLPAISASAWVAGDLTDGKALARAPQPYHFAFNFVYRGTESQLGSAEQTFASAAMRSAFDVRYDGGTHIVVLAADSGSVSAPSTMAELLSDSSYAPGSTFVHSFQLYASLKFGWGLLDPNPLTVKLAVRDSRGGETTATVTGAFPVVASLAFHGAIDVRRPDGTAVPSGGFARAGETLTFSGGSLSYAGTTTPPSGAEIAVLVVDGTGASVHATYDAQNGNLRAQVPLGAADDPSDEHTVEARAVGSGALLASLEVALATDALTPGFGLATPGPNEVVTQANYPVSIRVFDSGSGVDGTRVEYAVSHSSPPAFNDWHSATAQTGQQVTAQATVSLLEQSFNYVRFRAYDRVGNGPSYSDPLPIELDYGAIDFAMVSPSETEWLRDGAPTVTFSVHKGAVPSIDLATVEIEVNGQGGGTWHSLGLAGTTLDARFTAAVGLQEGAQNEVRVRASLVGHDAVYVSAPFRLKVDTQLPGIEMLAPAAGAWATSGTAESVSRVTDAGSGPEGPTVEFRYLLPGGSRWSDWTEPTLEAADGGFLARGAVPVRDGVENFVVWQAFDQAGNGPATSAYQRLLADSRPVAFEKPTPADGARLESVSRLSITIDDADGSGVDLSTVEASVLLPSGKSTGWMNALRTGISTRVTVSLPFTLTEGPSTVVWRARDAAGTALTESAPAKVTVAPPVVYGHPPTLVLTSPVSGGHYRAGSDVRFDALRSFDPDGASLFYQWSVDGQPQPTHAGAFWMSLGPGEHTVTLVVSDGSQSPDITIAFTVDAQASAPGPLSSPAGQAMLISFVLLLSAAVGARVWASRARRALRH